MVTLLSRYAVLCLCESGRYCVKCERNAITTFAGKRKEKREQQKQLLQNVARFAQQPEDSTIVSQVVQAESGQQTILKNSLLRHAQHVLGTWQMHSWKPPVQKLAKASPNPNPRIYRYTFKLSLNF